MSRIFHLIPHLFCSIIGISCLQYHSQEKQQVVSSRDLSNRVVSSFHETASSPEAYPTPGGLMPSESQTASPSGMQLRFGMEYEIKQKSSIPKEIWIAMIESEDNEATREQVLKQDDPDVWVDSSLIDLNVDNQSDYVIVAKSGNWLGANITAMWVFLRENGKYRSVLRTSALQLEFSKKTRRGFRIITTAALTAVEFCETKYMFDGAKYKVVSSKTGKIK